uniref:Uncharacterized protein n=1 Tax=Arundo donax TaxID=35708 RepID=A0A0A8YI01_ARUDO
MEYQQSQDPELQFIMFTIIKLDFIEYGKNKWIQQGYFGKHRAPRELINSDNSTLNRTAIWNLPEKLKSGRK